MRHIWLEQELEILLSLVQLLDGQLQALRDKSMEADDPDSYGYFDAAEHLTGLGFVACQTYIATVCGDVGLEKHLALKAGPRHASGIAKIQIVNHAANYWKHNNDQPLEKTTHRREAIEKAFESVGFPVGTDYPLAGVLTELSDPYGASLAVIADILREWKAETCTDT